MYVIVRLVVSALACAGAEVWMDNPKNSAHATAIAAKAIAKRFIFFVIKFHLFFRSMITAAFSLD